MFFFFVGGVDQQVRQVVKRGVGRCINCGSMADLVDYDKVLKLFFLPVWKWPGKEPLLYCNNCKLMFPPSFSLPPPPPPPSTRPSSSSSTLPGDVLLRCYSCARVVDADYRFCPFCGVSL